MTVLEIVKRDFEKLTKPSEAFDFANPQMDPQELATNLVETMYENNGLGLAAIQVGIPLRVFAMRGSPMNFVLFNPRVVMPSDEYVILEEACLSWPGLVFKINRPKHVRVRFAGPNGEVVSHTFSGMTARVVQHEITHLDGEVFWAGVKKYRVEKAIKKAKKLGYDYEGQGLLKFAE